MGKKNPEQNKLINEALFMIQSFRVAISGMTERQRTKMAMAFLALADVRRGKKWHEAEDVTTVGLGTREIIGYVNKYFNEKISMGSYDDVRRHDLKPLLQAGIVERSKPQSAQNDPRRGYGLSAEYCRAVRAFGTPEWDAALSNVVKTARPVVRPEKIPVKIPNREAVYLSLGDHNTLQKRIIEDMIPAFCPHDTEILYLGDSAKKHIINEEEKLRLLKFSEIGHGLLPDVVAYSKSKDWIYLIEAFNTSNPINDVRKVDMAKLTEKCTAKVLFITAFLDRTAFRKEIADIAWATEVWLADTPEHMIHFDGTRFLEPY